MSRFLRVALLGLVFLASSAPRAAAQVVEEGQLLREAAAREAQGDFDGAERVLRRLLVVNPGSSGALFALERVLRARGEPRALLSVVDTFLAHDPSASGVRQLKLRVLVEVDSLGALEEEAERWLGAEPPSETAYREVARIFERAFGASRAIQTLERGRAATGNPDALALEIGDLLAATRQIPRALEEWALAVGSDGAHASTVARRVAGLSEDPQGAGRMLVGILARAREPGRNRAAVQIALELKLGSEALELSRRLASGMDDRARLAFLSDVARRARDADLGPVATWAYAELGQGASSAAERRQFDQRLVEMSLSAGDTATALEAQGRVVASFTPGSVDRRRAVALEIRLQGGRDSSEDLKAHLETFRGEFPDAPELDELAAEVSVTLARRGDRAGARSMLEGMEGPRCSFERGYLLLAGDSVAEARSALLLALGGLTPAEATGVIQLLSLLGRLSPPGVAVLARAGSTAHEGRGVEAARSVAAALGDLPESERAPLLAEAARMADQGGARDEGAELRRRLLRDHPQAPEWAEAMLALARYSAETTGGRAEARRLLETLVERAPGSAVAPDARRELERLRRGP